MSKWTMSFAAVAVLGLAVSFAQAAPLASWDTSDLTAVDGSGATYAPSADAVAAGVAGAVLDVGPGMSRKVNQSGDILGYGAKGATEADLAAAIGQDDYFVVTITPDAGFALAISGVDFNFATEHNTGDITTVSLLSDLTQSTADTWDAADSLGSIGLDDIKDFSASVDLSGFSALQNITQAVEFRFYVHEAKYTATAYGFGTEDIANDPAVDDLVFNGTVVPEPTTMGLLALGALGVIRRRRRA